MPLTFNLGAVIGPILGGFLADPTSGGSPASNFFGPGTFLGGENGVEWMRRWKYALPNVVSAILLFAVTVICFLFLEEVRRSIYVPILLIVDQHDRRWKHGNTNWTLESIPWTN